MYYYCQRMKHAIKRKRNTLFIGISKSSWLFDNVKVSDRDRGRGELPLASQVSGNTRKCSHLSSVRGTVIYVYIERSLDDCIENLN